MLLTAAVLSAQKTPSLPEALDLFRQGKLAEAEATLQPLTKATPGDPAVWNLLGAVLDARKDYGRAEVSLKKAQQLAPKSPAVLNNLGNHYLAAGKPEAALAAFQKVVAIDPGHQNANLQLAQLLVERKEGKRALECLARLKAPDSEAPPVQLLRARALRQAGRADEAAALLTALEKTAEGPAAWYSIGMALVEASDFSGAEAAFSRALEAAPGDPDILYNLGVASLHAGHAERAQQVFETILRTRPDDAEVMFQLGRAISQQGRTDDAILYLLRARKLAPQRADIILTLANTAARAGFCGDAALTFDDYLKLRPDDDVARRERGFANACAGFKDLALPDLEWYLKRHPNDPDGHFQLGFALTVSDSERALHHLNEAIRLKPDFAEAYLVRGALYQQTGKPAKALPDLEYAVSRLPDNIRGVGMLGWNYLQLERPRDAIPVLRRGLERAPKDSRLLMYLGRALYDTGQDEEAARVLEEFSKVGPDRLQERFSPGKLSLLSLPPAEFKARYEENLRTALKSRSGEAEVRGKLAGFLLADNRRDEAMKEYREVLAGEAKPAVLLECARSLMGAGEYATAGEFLRRVLAADPNPGARLNYVITLLNVHDPDAALRELDRFPENERLGDYYLLRAQVFDVLGKIPEAVENLNLGFSKAPKRADLYEKATYFLLKRQMDKQALTLLEQATAILPDEFNLLLLKATVLAIDNRTDDALAQLRAISTRWPEASRVYLVRGIIEENHARSKEALKSIQTAIAMGEQSPEAYYYLAQSRSHVTPDEPKPAFEAIRKAVELDPSDPWAQALAGRLAWEMNDFARSVRYLQEAIRLKSDFVKAHFWLGTTYRSMGKEAEADTEMAEVERIHTQNPKAETEEAPGTRDRLFPLSN